MDVTADVAMLVGETLGLGERAERLTRDSELLGAIPEFDSQAVVSVLVAVEEHFGIQIDDDEVTADIFVTLGDLVDFVAQKVGE